MERSRGAENLSEGQAKGIRTCALLVLTTIAITDHRYLPGSERCAKVRPPDEAETL